MSQLAKMPLKWIIQKVGSLQAALSFFENTELEAQVNCSEKANLMTH